MTDGMNRRIRRNIRLSDPAPIILQRRDVDILEAVHTFRVLRQDQLQALFFGPSGQSAAKRRLRKLFDHGLLARHFLPVMEDEGRSPTLYILDRRGAEILRARRGDEELTWYSSQRDLKAEFLAHTLAINQVMIAVTLASQREGFKLHLWKTENELKAGYDRVSLRTAGGSVQQMAVIPDSYFVLKISQRTACFALEVDRGTMALDRYKNKILAYLAYASQPYEAVPSLYEQRYGTRSLRVLCVVDKNSGGEKRLANLKAATEDAGGGGWFWFALLSDLNAESILFAPVWRRAGDDGRHTLVKFP